MNDPDADYTLLSGISPPAAFLHSWTAAGMRGKHEAILVMQIIAV